MWEVSRAVRERDRAVVVLKGEAWYLRKQIAGKRKDHALKVYGGDPLPLPPLRSRTSSVLRERS
jgi:hypothetical protein